MKDQGLHGLLPLIPCNLHAVHNAFRKGLDDFGQEAEQLVIDLFYFLKAQIGLQLDEETFIKHVQSIWLTLIPATARVLSRWDAACKYFLEDLPKQSRESKSEKTLLHNERYRRICSKLRDPVVLVQLYFLQNLEPLFTPFLALFQREEPLIHNLEWLATESAVCTVK